REVPGETACRTRREYVGTRRRMPMGKSFGPVEFVESKADATSCRKLHMRKRDDRPDNRSERSLDGTKRKTNSRKSRVFRPTEVRPFNGSNRALAGSSQNTSETKLVTVMAIDFLPCKEPILS